MSKPEKLSYSDIPRLVDDLYDATIVLPAVFRSLIEQATSPEEKKLLEEALCEAEEAAHIFNQAVFSTQVELGTTSPTASDVPTVPESSEAELYETDLAPELTPPVPVPHRI